MASTDDTQPIEVVEAEEVVEVVPQTVPAPATPTATHTAYPFVDSRRFVWYSVAVTIGVSLVLLAIASQVSSSFNGSLRGGVWVLAGIMVFGWLVFAAFWYRAVRARAREHRYSETQAQVAVTNEKIRVSTHFIDRARHVFTNADHQVRWMTRHSKWELVPLGIALTLSVGGLVWFWNALGDKHTVSLGWLQSTLTAIQQTSPAAAESSPQTEPIKLPAGLDLHLWWVIVPLLVFVLALGGMYLVRWYTTFYVVTDRSVLPKLKLPPIVFPMMDNNELAVVMSSIKIVDNVDTQLGNLLNIGGVQISTDATEVSNGTESRVQYLDRWLHGHRELVRAIRQAIAEAPQETP